MTLMEMEVVRLIGEGYKRREIAEEIGLGESTVRRMIRRLCQNYDCKQRELPDVTAKENNAQRGSH